ncbi:MAG: hypothetical protein ACYDBT_03045 [Desulfobulbaceae bacterium]
MDYNKIVNIIKAVLGFYVFWSGISYYYGFKKYTKDREQKRIERVEKYGCILIFASAVALISGLYLMLEVFFLDS